MPKPNRPKPNGPGPNAELQTTLELSNLEISLLEKIQTDFPIAPRPFAKIAKELAITEEEAFNLTENLRAKGLIRRIGANFNASALGCHSTLCAAKVPPAQLDEFIKTVNAKPGVTHNYLRDHSYNVWFTIIGNNQQEVLAELKQISHNTGVNILNLPADKIYKLKVDFKFKR